MEVLETKEVAAERAEKERKEDEITREVVKTLREAQAKVNAEKAESAEAPEPTLSVDVDQHIEETPMLKTMNDNPVAGKISDSAQKTRTVSVTQDEKDAFMESVVTGGRYVGSKTIFDGRLKVKFRSRSMIESEAIDGYIRRQIASGKIKTEQEYADVMRLCVLSAGVAEINDDHFPTMSEAGETDSGMFYTETKEGLTPPKWLWLYNKWATKPESLVAIVIEAYFEFEAKYWLMIRNASNQNFWTPGESTGN